MKSTDTYNLMNKDNLILQFSIKTGDIINQTESSIPYYLQRLIDRYDGDPDGEQPIISWVKSRLEFYCLPSGSERKLYSNILGLHSLSEIVDKLHCISMNDTFWVKRSDQTDLRWSSVSPFQNIHSKIISAYALNGGETDIQKDNNYLSPLPSTRGSYPHTWKHKPSHSHGGTVELNHIFVKGSSKNSPYIFRSDEDCIEPYCEYFASQIASFLGFNCVEYKLRQEEKYKNVGIVTECNCYTTEEIGSVSAKDLGLDTYKKVIEYCKKLGEESLNTCLDMFFLDCLLLNTDRHFRNIEFFMNNETLEIVGIVPIFDNNKAFYSILQYYFKEDTEDNWNSKITAARKNYRAYGRKRLRELFTLVCSYRSYEEELKKLKQFKINLDEYDSNIIKGLDVKRLEYMNHFIQNQIRYLLRVDKRKTRRIN